MAGHRLKGIAKHTVLSAYLRRLNLMTNQMSRRSYVSELGRAMALAPVRLPSSCPSCRDWLLDSRISITSEAKSELARILRRLVAV